MDKLGKHLKNLPPLPLGCSVLIQNQLGNHPKRWEKRGTVVEVLPHRQYRVRIDGSRRLTLRNRQFLKQYKPLVVENRPKLTVSQPQKDRRKLNPDTEVLRSQSQLAPEKFSPSNTPQEIPHLIPRETGPNTPRPKTTATWNELEPQTPLTTPHGIQPIPFQHTQDETPQETQEPIESSNIIPNTPVQPPRRSTRVTLGKTSKFEVSYTGKDYDEVTNSIDPSVCGISILEDQYHRQQ